MAHTNTDKMSVFLYFCLHLQLKQLICTLKHQHDKNPNQYNGEILDVQGPKSHGKKMYIESYGCQMNFSDSEIVASILGEAGYATTRELKKPT